MFVGHLPILIGVRGPKSMAARVALNDVKLQRSQAKERSDPLADGGGLYLEVQPTGKKV